MKMENLAEYIGWSTEKLLIAAEGAKSLGDCKRKVGQNHRLAYMNKTLHSHFPKNTQEPREDSSKNWPRI